MHLTLPVSHLTLVWEMCCIWIMWQSQVPAEPGTVPLTFLSTSPQQGGTCVSNLKLVTFNKCRTHTHNYYKYIDTCHFFLCTCWLSSCAALNIYFMLNWHIILDIVQCLILVIEIVFQRLALSLLSGKILNLFTCSLRCSWSLSSDLMDHTL